MTKPIAIAFFAAGLAVPLGCDREEAIRVYRAPKDPPPVVAAKAPSSEASAGLQWTLPLGWKELPGDGQMRYATIQITASEPPVELSVIPLGQEAGSLLANVNRWEGQLGLKPSAEAELDKVVRHVDVGPLHVDVIDLAGPQQRMLAAILEHGGRTWFFKALGPAETVGPQKQNFDAFIGSLRAGETTPASQTATPAPQPPPAVATAEIKAGPVAFTVPEGWRRDETPRQMRIATIFAGPAEKQAELAISKFPKEAMANYSANINRWRGQVGLPPTTDADAHKPAEVTVAGVKTQLFDIAGPKTAGDAGKRMMVALVPQGGDIFFFRLLGPSDTVGDNKDKFEGLLKSVRIAQ